MTVSMNLYRNLNKNDWVLVENHVKFRKGEIVFDRIENNCNKSQIPRATFKNDDFELFDLQKGYNSVFASYIFTEFVIKDTAYTHMFTSKKLIEISMWLLYDCFENEFQKDIIMKLVSYLDNQMVLSGYQSLKNSNFFNFPITRLIQRVSRYLTTISLTNAKDDLQAVVDLLKKLFYINNDYIQTLAIKECFHLKSIQIYKTNICNKQILATEGIDSINLRLNPTINRIIIGCVEYGVKRAFELNMLDTSYLCYDFLKRLVNLYEIDEITTKISDYSECYIGLYNILLRIHEFYSKNKNQLPPNLAKRSVLTQIWYEELFDLDAFNKEIKRQMEMRLKFIDEQIRSFKMTLNDEMVLEDSDKKKNARIS